MAYIREHTTIENVRSDKPAMIFYSAKTCWWTHRPTDIGRLSNGLPCDPRGAVLYQTDNIEGFLSSAEEKPEYYGKHGLRAFIAAHNDNCLISETDQRFTCLETFDAYNVILDFQDHNE